MSNENNKTEAAFRGSVLTAFSLGNFKAFADTQSLPIKPLTLIFGANSSGKSSIIHSLLLANHALAHGNLDVHQPQLAGQSVDLGGYYEYVHGHQVSHGCTLGFSLRHNPLTTNYFSEFNHASMLIEIGQAFDADSGKEQIGSIGVSAFNLTLDNQLLLRAKRNSLGSLHIVEINFDHHIFNPFFNEIDRIRPDSSQFRKPINTWDLAPIWELRDQLNELAEKKASKAEQEQLSAFFEDLRQKRQNEEKIRTNFPNAFRAELKEYVNEIPLRPENVVPISTRPRGPRDQYLKNLASEDDWKDVWRGMEQLDNLDFLAEAARIFSFEIEILLDGINAKFRNCLESLKYLGPLRCYPPRHLAGMHGQDPNWFSGGGHAWDILRREPEVVTKVNNWLETVQGPGTGYEIKVRHLKDLKRVSDSEKQRMAKRLQEMSLNDEAGAKYAVDELLIQLANESSGSAFGEIVLCDRSTGLEVSHRDVGVGISQVLPVLVHAYADQRQIVAIEQPEIHLHPALQAELGDIFIESALGERKNTFILETHSEHLILRIMRRMRETFQKKLPPGALAVHPKDVAVLFVERDGPRSIIREMPLNERGELVKSWPGGFFEEDLREVLS